jgi:hypothetical protein
VGRVVVVVGVVMVVVVVGDIRRVGLPSTDVFLWFLHHSRYILGQVTCRVTQ